MASRWMQSMRQRQRQHRRRLGKLSLTKREIKFYTQKPNESIDSHIDRMRLEASEERVRPNEWYRVLARLLQSMGVNSNISSSGDEWKIVRYHIKQHSTIAEIEKAILRYRRIMGTGTSTNTNIN